MKSIGPKFWASSSSFYKRSSEFLIFELRFCQNRPELRLYFEAQVWTVSCASELLIWIISDINMTFFNANHLKSVSLKKICNFLPVFIWIILENNEWVKSSLKIIVKSSEKSIFWGNSSRELEMSWASSSQVWAWALAWAALLPHSLSLKLKFESSNTAKTELQAQRSSQLAYALH